MLSKAFEIQFIFDPLTMYTKKGKWREKRRTEVLVFSCTGTCYDVSIEF